MGKHPIEQELLRRAEGGYRYVVVENKHGFPMLYGVGTDIPAIFKYNPKYFKDVKKAQAVRHRLKVLLSWNNSKKYDSDFKYCVCWGNQDVFLITRDDELPINIGLTLLYYANDQYFDALEDKLKKQKELDEINS